MKVFILILSNIMNLALGFFFSLWVYLSVESIMGFPNVKNHNIEITEIELYNSTGWIMIIVYLLGVIFLNFIMKVTGDIELKKYINCNWVSFSIAAVISFMLCILK